MSISRFRSGHHCTFRMEFVLIHARVDTEAFDIRESLYPQWENTNLVIRPTVKLGESRNRYGHGDGQTGIEKNSLFGPRMKKTKSLLTIRIIQQWMLGRNKTGLEFSRKRKSLLWVFSSALNFLARILAGTSNGGICCFWKRRVWKHFHKTKVDCTLDSTLFIACRDTSLSW